MACNCHTSLKDFKCLTYEYNIKEEKFYLKMKRDEEMKNNRHIGVVDISKTEMDNITEKKITELFNLEIEEKECEYHHRCHLISLYDSDRTFIASLCRPVNKIFINYVIDR